MPDTAAISGKRLAESDGGVRELLGELEAIVRDRRTARELLAILLGVSPGWVAAHPDGEVPVVLRERAEALARRIAAGEPVAYATGRAAFRHLTLSVDQRVLIPRAETEVVVEQALKVCPSGVAVDAGTGSGAIALSLATEGDFDRVIGTDISLDALDVARRNAEAVPTRSRVEFRCGSLLEPVSGERVDLVVANPPYIAAREMHELPAAVRDWEPPVALVAGEDGLDHTRSLVRQAASLLVPGGWLVLECDSRRASQVATLLARNGSYGEIRVADDLAGRPRVAVARRRTQ